MQNIFWNYFVVSSICYFHVCSFIDQQLENKLANFYRNTSFNIERIYNFRNIYFPLYQILFLKYFVVSNICNFHVFLLKICNLKINWQTFIRILLLTFNAFIIFEIFIFHYECKFMWEAFILKSFIWVLRKKLLQNTYSYSFKFRI